MMMEEEEEEEEEEEVGNAQGLLMNFHPRDCPMHSVEASISTFARACEVSQVVQPQP